MTRLLFGLLMAAVAPTAGFGQTAPPLNQPPPIIENAATAPRAVTPAPARESRLFELRTYHAADGKLDALHERFQAHTIRLLARHGIECLGFWVPRDNGGNNLIVLHAYPNLAARTTAWQRFAIDPEWRKIKAGTEGDGKLVDQIDGMILGPTDFCPVVVPTKAAAPRCFELRIVGGGNPTALAARYRDHALKAFADNGLTHVGTWVPTGGKVPDGVALVSLVACDSTEAHAKATRSFRNDPFMASLSATTDAGGSPQGNGSIKVLIPTDYSPMR